MRRKWRISGALVLLIAAWLLSALPASAQNAAEAGSSGSTAANAAEKSATSPSADENSATTEDDGDDPAAAEDGADGEDDSAKEQEEGSEDSGDMVEANVVEAGAEEASEPAAAEDTAAEPEPEDEGDGTGKAEDDDDATAEPAPAPPNAAESPATGAGNDDTAAASEQETAAEDAATGTGEGTEQVAGEGNVAETEGSPPAQSRPADPPPEGAPAEPPPNAAETRPAGSAGANRAEGTTTEEGSNVAEPPEPEYTLPAPADVAGDPTAAAVPEVKLSIPPLGDPPPQEALDAYYNPGRGYLERPLPDLDITETDEERTARSIEESLALIDLAVEQRPEDEASIPLPAGVLTFKASDAFQYDRHNKVMRFTGNVELLFKDIAIWADYIEVDDSAATVYARGYVALQQDIDVVYCDEAYLNYDTETMELFWVEGNTGGKRLAEPLYYEADRAYGTFDHLVLENAVITTCSPFCGAKRDYTIKAEKAHYKRGTSFIMHNVYLYLREVKAGWFPTLAVPIPKDPRPEERESEIQQNYGYSRGEGWFAKFAYLYWYDWVEDLSKPLKGVAILNIMTKRGVGGGFRQDWYLRALGAGTLRAYYQEDWPERVADEIIGRNTGSAGEDFSVEFGQDLNISRSLNGDIDLKRVNRYIPSTGYQSGGRRTNTWDGKFTLNYRKGSTQAGLSANYDLNIRGGQEINGEQQPRSEDVTTNVTFNYQTKITKELQFRLNQTYRATKGGNYPKLPADQEGTRDISLTYTGKQGSDLEGWSASLDYRRSAIDYDGDSRTTERNQQINDMKPRVSVTAPKDLLGDGNFFNKFTFEYENKVTGRRSAPESAKRYHLTVGGSEMTRYSRAANLNYSLNFDQYWYDDGNALYTIRPRATFRYDDGGWWAFNFNWNLTYRQGVRNPPVSSDRASYSQTASYGLTFSDHQSWRWSLKSGYDFKEWQHRSVTSSFEWDPNRLFGLSHTTNYDLRSKRWGQGRLKASWFSPHITEDGTRNWALAMGYDYDTDYWNWFAAEKWSLTYFRRYKNGWSGEITGYYRRGQDVEPGFTDDFFKDFIKQVAIRKVNCCLTWEAVWRSELNQFSLYMFLNALPQYPGTYIGERPFDNDYEHMFAFPQDQLQRDIIEDVTGIGVSGF